MKQIFSKERRLSDSLGRALALPELLRERIIFLLVPVMVIAPNLGVIPWLDPQLSPDSHSYLRAASSLIQGDGLGEDYLLWPPFYPVVLAASGLFGQHEAANAGLVNALILVVLTFGCWRVLTDTIDSLPLRVAGLLLVTFSPPIYLVSGFVWSEPLFVLISFFCLYYWSRFLVRQETRDLLLSMLLLAAALLTRHVALVLASVMFLSLACSRSCSVTQKARISALSALAFLPYLYWLFRTWRLSGTMAGPRHESAYSLYENISAFAKVISHWWFPHSYFTDSEIVPLLVLAVSALVMGITVAGCRVNMGKPAASGPGRFGTVFSSVLAVYIVLYAIFLVVAGTVTVIDLPNDRYLSPILFPYVYVFLHGASRLWKRYRQPSLARFRILAGLGYAWLLVWLAAPNALNEFLLGFVS